MNERTGIYVVFFLYRARYSFVSGHTLLENGAHHVTLGSLQNALTFMRESDAIQFIEQDLRQNAGENYHISEVSLGELLLDFPKLYELRRASMKSDAA